VTADDFSYFLVKAAKALRLNKLLIALL